MSTVRSTFWTLFVAIFGLVVIAILCLTNHPTYSVFQYIAAPWGESLVFLVYVLSVVHVLSPCISCSLMTLSVLLTLAIPPVVWGIFPELVSCWVWAFKYVPFVFYWFQASQVFSDCSELPFVHILSCCKMAGYIFRHPTLAVYWYFSHCLAYWFPINVVPDSFCHVSLFFPIGFCGKAIDMIVYGVSKVFSTCCVPV